MQSALRKMGNSTGMIVPSAVLREAGLASGAILDVSVSDGRIIATPVAQTVRAGWAEAAAQIASAPPSSDEADWSNVPNEGDAGLTW